MKNLAITFALSMLLSSVANSQQVTGNDILENLNSDIDYIRGLTDGYILGMTTGLNYGGEICLPEGVTGQQMVDVVETYLLNNPNERNENGGLLTAYSLLLAFPC